MYKIKEISLFILTMLLRNWLSRKCAATWAGNKLCNILLFDSCNTSISFFSWDACNCHRKSNLAVHSTKRPWTRMAIIKIKIRANEIKWSGIEELFKYSYNNKKVSKSSFKGEKEKQYYLSSYFEIHFDVQFWDTYLTRLS